LPVGLAYQLDGCERKPTPAAFPAYALVLDTYSPLTHYTPFWRSEPPEFDRG
jgi:hypothetical protein